MAQTLKQQMDNKEEVKFIDDYQGNHIEKRVCRPYESPCAEVNELDQWEATKLGQDGGYDSYWTLNLI